MLTKTKIMLAAVLMLGTASAALAEPGQNDSGGYVVPGSLAGLNPAFHPAIFGIPAVAKSYSVVDTAHGWLVSLSRKAQQGNQ
jgi:hypothetical protein